VKLLRALEDHQVRPLGSEHELPVDVRVLAATNSDLEGLVAQGRFRRDLFARLGLVALRVPPLRERREDLGILLRAVLRSSPPGLARVRFDLEALRLTLRHSWPLNVRELRTAALSAVDLASGGDDASIVIHPHHLPEGVRNPATSPLPSRQASDPAAKPDLTAPEQELRDALVDHLRRANGNVAAVAREMGKARTQVNRWIARYGIDVRSVRRPKV
jgi:transcriptional regulator with GAF, ATPase, and Fis domain